MIVRSSSQTIPVREYDELHSISDLHLGGAPGFQMFAMGGELSALIGHLAGAPSGRRVALVINGDFVDFLAESPSRYFDPFGAEAKLTRIAGDESFAPVFAALRQFVSTPDRTLIVNIGNHDLELALPWVREALLELISQGDPGRRARVEIVTDGTGVRCSVGTAQVLCLHGNEVDTWNVVDHEALRRIARDIHQARSVDGWTPNAGTKMVIDVMNDLKRRFPFIDLLKPEGEGAVPTLLALDPRVAGRIPKLVPIGVRGVWDTLRKAVGLLEVDGNGGAPAWPVADLRPSAGWRAPRRARRARREQGDALATALLDRAEELMQAHTDPMMLVGTDGTSQLGVVGAFWNAARRDVPEALREALEGLENDRSFDVGHADETFRSIDARVGADISFLLAGHTHLARALPRAASPGYYLNTGTWARLIHLTPDLLNDKARFAAAFAAFGAGTMAALEGVGGLVIRRPTFASIWKDGASTRAELREYDSQAGATPFRSLQPAPFTLG